MRTSAERPSGEAPRPRVAAGLRRACLAASFAAALSQALPADAGDRTLHEFLRPDDREDVALAATTADGALPAAIETPSGVVRAPNAGWPPRADEVSYREQLSSSREPFRPDRDTRRPERSRYDDPFSPSVAPYKRLRAYDMVGADYGLRVRDTSLVPVPVGGEVRAGLEESFYADLTVDFDAGAVVLIPSVGPGARIIRYHTTPELDLQVLRDGADEWYAKAITARGRVHLVMLVAAPIAAFGGELDLPAWDQLPRISPLPPGPAAAAAKVRHALGLARAQTPSEAVRAMVAYFRAFEPSGEAPRGYGDIYLDLSLSKKGVCRHRAFAFLVTALGFGIGARLVTNEAHAWVEVRGARGWQRIDLGGAAGAIDDESADGRPRHRPPDDPFGWPASAERSSGGAVVVATPPSQGPTDPRRAPAEPRMADGERVDERERRAPPSASGAGEEPVDGREDDERPRPELTLAESEVRVVHGGPLRVSGKVMTRRGPCGPLRVDVALRRPGLDVALGALVTEASGAFEGSLFLPLTLPVGDYDVVASTPGDATCGAASTR